MEIVTRFAPSPTGQLHLGSAHAALYAWRRARQAGGRFLLRIEDIDAQRCRPEYAAGLLEDLAWLGLDWDGEVRVQSEHLAEYEAVLAGLRTRGLIYPCFCSRADIAAAGSATHGPEGPVYPGICRALPDEVQAKRMVREPYAWRLDVGRALASVAQPLWFHEQGAPRRCAPARFGDVVLGRRDSVGSYHLCVTHDDWKQGVTLVTRAVDLLVMTEVQRLIQAVMGWPAPEYAHHALLTDSEGRRLAKRDHAVSIRALRESGLSPVQVRALAKFPDPG